MWLLVWSLGAHAGVTPGIDVKYVVPPPKVVDGVKKVTVAKFTGKNGDAISAEIVAALEDPERISTTDGQDLAAVGKQLLGTATEMGSQMAANAVGGGIQGKLVGGLTKQVGNMVAGELEADPITPEDGFKADVWQVGPGGDAKLTGGVDVGSKDSTFKKKVPMTDSDGNPIKDDKGNVKYTEITCQQRDVKVTVSWKLAGKSGEAEGEKARSISDVKCPGDGSLASVDQLSQPLLIGWGVVVANQIAPSWRIRHIPMKRAKGQKEERKLMKGDALMPALCNLRALASFDEGDLAANWNMGSLLEGMGHNDAALEAYNKALAIKGNKKIAKAVARTDKRKGEIKTLTGSYGLKYKVGPPDYTSCPKIPDGKRMYVKKLTDLYEGESGDAAAGELDKGTKVFVSEEGARFKVTTLDGKEGWVNPKMLK